MEKMTNESLFSGFSTRFELSILLAHRAKLISLGAVSPLPQKMMSTKKPITVAILELKHGYSTHDSLLQSFIELKNNLQPSFAKDEVKVQQKILIDDKNYEDFTIENDLQTGIQKTIIPNLIF